MTGNKYLVQTLPFVWSNKSLTKRCGTISNTNFGMAKKSKKSMGGTHFHNYLHYCSIEAYFIIPDLARKN